MIVTFLTGEKCMLQAVQNLEQMVFTVTLNPLTPAYTMRTDLRIAYSYSSLRRRYIRTLQTYIKTSLCHSSAL